MSIKRHNHKVHPCETSKKQDLLKHLTTFHKGKSILIVSNANSTTTVIEDKNLTLTNDAELSNLDKKYDILISYDIPKDPEDYKLRYKKATEMALVLVDEKEQVLLYAIEKLLGKNIQIEIVKGFELPVKETPYQKTKPTKSQLANADEDRKRKANEIDKEKKLDDKKNFSAKKDWDKKHSSSSKKTPKKIRIPAKKKD